MDAIEVQTVALSLFHSLDLIAGPWVVAFSHKRRIKKKHMDFTERHKIR